MPCIAQVNDTQLALAVMSVVLSFFLIPLLFWMECNLSHFLPPPPPPIFFKLPLTLRQKLGIIVFSNSF